MFVDKSGRKNKMAGLILVDTDILIDLGRDIDIAVARLETEEQQAILSISIITKMELIVGCQNMKELDILEEFLNRFEIIGLSEDIAGQAVELLRTYRLSHGLLIADSLIAATALNLKSPFLSKNQKHYKFIKGLKILSYPK